MAMKSLGEDARKKEEMLTGSLDQILLLKAYLARR